MKYPLIKKFVIFSLFSFVTVTAFASVNSDLNNFFNDLGFSDNTTAPNAYAGQEAGYYSGGSLFARDSVRDVQIAQVQLPGFRSGCGGIDLFTGGFSFINSQQLVNLMENIINNSMGYAFNLALESTTPEIANVMKYINTIANTINNANINSCETAAGLVGTVWPKTHEAQQQVCEDIGNTKGLFTDWAAARQQCSTGGDMTQTLNKAQNDPNYQSMLLTSGNIAWKALQKNSFLSSDPELAELLMSLSGTLILQGGSSDDASHQFKVLASLSSDNQLLKALLHGGTAKVYVCDSTNAEGCLNPTIQTLNISPDSGLQTQVSKLLQDMTNKILTDTALTQAEMGLLQTTRIPLYKMLNVESAFIGDKKVLDIVSFADVIATDILFQYLDENLSVVHTSVNSLQYPESIMEPFEQGISQARAGVLSAQRNATSQISLAAQLINQTQTIEQMLAGELSSQMSNTLQWADRLRH